MDIKEITQLLFNFDNESLLIFKQGYTLGILVVTGLTISYLFLRLTYKIFKATQRKCNGITIHYGQGQLSITTNAISDLIKSAKNSFKAIDISKVEILKHKKNYIINLQIIFDMSGGKLTDQIILLEQKIKNDLRTVFGIDNVSNINIKLKKTVGTPEPQEILMDTTHVLTPAPEQEPSFTEEKETKATPITEETTPVKDDAETETQEEKSSENF